MAAPSSAQTSPSQIAKNAPSTQPIIACGPPIADTIRGIVIKGPTPIMSIMFSAVADERLMPRTSGESLSESVVEETVTKFVGYP